MNADEQRRQVYKDGVSTRKKYTMIDRVLLDLDRVKTHQVKRPQATFQHFPITIFACIIKIKICTIYKVSAPPKPKTATSEQLSTTCSPEQVGALDFEY